MAVPGSAVDAADVAPLASHIDGAVLLPGDAGYAAECASFNTALPRRPAVVAAAASTADVSRAVRFAGERDLPVGVLATGHGTSQPGNGALLITTRRLHSVTIDPRARTARAEAGTRWQEVIDGAAPYGLAPLSGSSPLVGVVGYTTGGGLSPIMGRAHGWAADRVRAFEIVTADGLLLRVTPEQDPDLFWAVRGGKDNFGIVTAIEFELFEAPRLYGGGLYFPGQYAAEVLHAFRSWTETVPVEMSASVGLLRLPPLDFVPEPLRGQFTVHVRIAYLGSPEEGARLVAPIREIAPAVIDTVTDMLFTDVAAVHAEPASPLPVYEASTRLAEFPEAAAAAILGAAGPDADCPLAMVEVRQLGGALAREPEVPNAVSGRTAPFQVFCAGVGGTMEAPFIYAGIDEVFRGLKPWRTPEGTLNWLSMRDIGPDSIRDAFGKDTYNRLVAVKRAYDPANLFRINHNIPPEL